MRKDVLISLLAITGAPVAALADADVVIDKTAWTGDDLTVSEDGSVTVSTGKEVSIEKELAPGKYMLQRVTFTDNAKIVAVYKGKEYAPEVAFTIEGDASAKVRVKVRAVTPGEFKFSGVKFTLIFDFAAPVKELGAQLGEISAVPATTSVEPMLGRRARTESPAWRCRWPTMPASLTSLRRVIMMCM